MVLPAIFKKTMTSRKKSHPYGSSPLTNNRNTITHHTSAKDDNGI